MLQYHTSEAYRPPQKLLLNSRFQSSTRVDGQDEPNLEPYQERHSGMKTSQVNDICLWQIFRIHVEDSSTSSCMERKYVKALEHYPPVSH